MPADSNLAPDESQWRRENVDRFAGKPRTMDDYRRSKYQSQPLATDRYGRLISATWLGAAEAGKRAQWFRQHGTLSNYQSGPPRLSETQRIAQDRFLGHGALVEGTARPPRRVKPSPGRAKPHIGTPPPGRVKIHRGTPSGEPGSMPPPKGPVLTGTDPNLFPVEGSITYQAGPQITHQAGPQITYQAGPRIVTSGPSRSRFVTPPDSFAGFKEALRGLGVIGGDIAPPTLIEPTLIDPTIVSPTPTDFGDEDFLSLDEADAVDVDVSLDIDELSTETIDVEVLEDIAPHPAPGADGLFYFADAQINMDEVRDTSLGTISNLLTPIGRMGFLVGNFVQVSDIRGVFVHAGRTDPSLDGDAATFEIVINRCDCKKLKICCDAIADVVVGDHLLPERRKSFRIRAPLGKKVWEIEIGEDHAPIDKDQKCSFKVTSGHILLAFEQGIDKYKKMMADEHPGNRRFAKRRLGEITTFLERLKEEKDTQWHVISNIEIICSVWIQCLDPKGELEGPERKTSLAKGGLLDKDAPRPELPPQGCEVKPDEVSGDIPQYSSDVEFEFRLPDFPIHGSIEGGDPRETLFITEEESIGTVKKIEYDMAKILTFGHSFGKYKHEAKTSADTIEILLTGWARSKGVIRRASTMVPPLGAKRDDVQASGHYYVEIWARVKPGSGGKGASHDVKFDIDAYVSGVSIQSSGKTENKTISAAVGFLPKPTGDTDAVEGEDLMPRPTVPDPKDRGTVKAGQKVYIVPTSDSLSKTMKLSKNKWRHIGYIGLNHNEFFDGSDSSARWALRARAKMKATILE